MAKQRRINTSQIIHDIRSGWDHKRLMGKYDLSETQLNRALTKLVNAKILEENEIKHLNVRKNRQDRMSEFAEELRHLIKKYRLTAAEAEALAARMRTTQGGENQDDDLTVAVHRKKKRKINARELAEDIQLGLDNENLKMKYGINQQQLDSVIERLIKAKLLTEAEVYDRSVPFDTQLIQAQVDAQAAIDELE